MERRVTLDDWRRLRRQDQSDYYAPMYDPGMQLETDRLILRQPRQSELDDWEHFMADPQTANHIGGVQPRSVVWRSMATMAGSWALTGFGMFSVLEKASGEWVGRLGPWFPEGWPGTEVGWGIRRASWGRGYATEGSIAAIDWAFDTLGWSEVIHTIAPDNMNSQAVAKRLGSCMLSSTTLPAPYANLAVDVWGQSRAQWRAQRATLPRRAS
jgi:RimJ/RimL family protein N-acetyltransferase